MATSLVKNEKIIKEYDYSRTSVKHGLLSPKTAQSQKLTVTNQRIIHEVTSVRKFSGNSITRKEIPLSASTFVSTSFKKRRSLIFLIVAILSLLVGVFATITVSWDDEFSITPLVISAVIGGAFLLRYFLSTRASLVCSIATKGVCSSIMELGASSLVSSRKPHIKRIRIYVDAAMGYEIAEQLGTVILQAQQESDQQ